MRKVPLLAIAAAFVVAGASPALAGDVSFSFGIFVDGDDYDRPPPVRYYERERWVEREPCDDDDDDDHRVYDGPPYGYDAHRERVVIIERVSPPRPHPHRHRRHGWDH